VASDNKSIFQVGFTNFWSSLAVVFLVAALKAIFGLSDRQALGCVGLIVLILAIVQTVRGVSLPIALTQVAGNALAAATVLALPNSITGWREAFTAAAAVLGSLFVSALAAMVVALAGIATWPRRWSKQGLNVPIRGIALFWALTIAFPLALAFFGPLQERSWPLLGRVVVAILVTGILVFATGLSSLLLLAGVVWISSGESPLVPNLWLLGLVLLGLLRPVLALRMAAWSQQPLRREWELINAREAELRQNQQVRAEARRRLEEAVRACESNTRGGAGRLLSSFTSNESLPAGLPQFQQPPFPPDATIELLLLMCVRMMLEEQQPAIGLSVTLRDLQWMVERPVHIIRSEMMRLILSGCLEASPIHDSLGPLVPFRVSIGQRGRQVLTC
jgi:hypothetical protein